MRLDQFLERTVRETPTAIFARQGDRAIDYATAWAEIDRMAAALLEAGLAPGDRFAYLGKNGIELVIAYLAASRSGAVIVPLNYRLAPAEWEAILVDSGARLAVARGDLVAAASGLVDRLPSVATWVAIDRPAPQGWIASEPWLAAAADRRIPPPPGDELCQMYTSGTTGRPKGAILTHGGVTTNAWQVSQLIPDNRRGERTLIVMPMFHAGAAGQLFGAVVNGSSVVLHEDFDPARVVRSLAEDAIGATSLVPAMIQACLTVADREPPRRYPVLKAMFYGAAPIDADTLRRAVAGFGCPMYQAYGMTETSTVLTVLSPADHERALRGRPELLASAGRPIPGTEVIVADGNDRPVPPGVPGQILARGPQLMKGYWQRPEATAAALAGGWMHTGDVGRFDEEGYLYLLDRLNDTIVSGGENIYPREIEDALLTHPDLVDAAVVGIPDERWGEAVLAFVVPRPDASVSEAGLIAHLRARVAGYKVPRQIVVTATLPRTATGKVLRRELREPYWKGRDRRVG